MMDTLQSKQVAEYFSRRLGSRVTVRSLRQTFPGVSRETWLVGAEMAGGVQDFVLRLDPPQGPVCPFSLRHEWEVYSRLWKSPVPVAEPLWFDEEIEFAGGRPHMVRRLVEGSTQIEGLSDPTPGGRELRRRVVFECVEKLALVHQLDWQSYGFDSFIPVPPSPEEALRTEFNIWKGIWKKDRPGSYPLLEEALCWLEENIPADTPRISLVKGNNGIGEEIWRGGRIVAMSDWELASLSDGVLDLAFSQGTLALGNFAEALRHYERCIGAIISPHRLAFCMFLIWFKQIASLRCYLYRHFLEGSDRRILGLSFGLLFTASVERRLSSCIGKDLAEAWLHVAGEEKSVYANIGG